MRLSSTIDAPLWPPINFQHYQDFHVGVPPGGTDPPQFPHLYTVQFSASAQVPRNDTTRVNDTQAWTPCAVNASSMDAERSECFSGDIATPVELRPPVPAHERIAPPEKAEETDFWRSKRRKPNVLTDAQKKNIYRKMPRGWEPLADSDIWALNPETLHNITGAHITTCRRWLRHPPPELVVRLVCIVMGGDLGAINETWRGWKLSKKGELSSPEEWTFTPGRIRTSYLGWDTNSVARDQAERRASEAENQARAAESKLQRSTQADFVERRWVEPGELTLTDEQAEQLRSKQHALRLQTTTGKIWPSPAMAARVQERPGVDDAEHERQQRQRYFYWRERQRRNALLR